MKRTPELIKKAERARAYGDQLKKYIESVREAGEIPAHPLYDVIGESEKHIEINRGGRGSGKSHTIIQKLLHKFRNEKRCNYLFSVKESTNVASSLIPTIEAILWDEGLNEEFTVTKSPAEVKNKFGRRIFLKGFDDPQKAKLISKVGISFIDELNHFTYEDFKMIVNSTREIEDWKVICAFNPVSDTIWVKLLLYDVQGWREKFTDIRSTCENNPFLPESKKQAYRDLWKIDEVSYMVDYLGEWGTLTSELVFGSKIRIVQEIPAHARFISYGLDFSNGGADPHALIGIYFADGKIYLKEIYQGHCDVINLEGERDLRQIIYEECHELKNPRIGVIADSANMGNINILRQSGINCVPAEKGPNSVSDGVKKLKLYQSINILQSSLNAVMQFRNYKWKKDKKTGLLLPEVDKTCVHHLIDATRYGMEVVDIC